MNALLLTLFVSGVLSVLGVLLFAVLMRGKVTDHVDRMALSPLWSNETLSAASAPSNPSHPENESAHV